MNNNIVLPVDPPQLTTIYLDSINILSSDIAQIHIDQNKVHDHYMLSIRVTKLCKNSICKPLSKISNDCLNEGKSPHEWKKANVHVHSKRKNRVWKTIGQSLYSLLVTKFLNISFTTKCQSFLLRTIWSLQINQDLDMETLVLTNHLILPVKYINCLMWSLKFEGFS